MSDRSGNKLKITVLYLKKRIKFKKKKIPNENRLIDKGGAVGKERGDRT